MDTTERVQCLIIGSGPAGYTAAIYASRAGLNPVLYQGIQPGGQLTITTEVENYPGYPDGIQGPDMMVNFEKQAARMGTDIRYGLATKVDFSGAVHKVQIDEEKWIEADAVIISTGASAKLCSQVHMIVRKGEMRASKVMQERVINMPNIKIYWNSETDEVIGDKKVEAVRIKNNQTGEKQEIPVSAFFVAIGHQPNSDIFKDFLEMDEAGYIKTIPGTSKTNVEGVFASGDVQDKIYRQAVTAAGSGCMAALDAERYLGAKGIH